MFILLIMTLLAIYHDSAVYSHASTTKDSDSATPATTSATNLSSTSLDYASNSFFEPHVHTQI